MGATKSRAEGVPSALDYGCVTCRHLVHGRATKTYLKRLEFDVMRRWLLIILLILIPYQSVWAGSAQYCAHEDDAAVAHFGHHKHKHSPARADRAATGTMWDADCSTCHMASAAPVFCGALQMTPLAWPESFPYAEPRYVSRVPAGPERPDRATPPPAVRFGGGVLAVFLS